MKNPNEKVYIPISEQKISIFAVWTEMFDEIKSSYELIWRLFLRDFIAGYKQSILGILWVIIMPLIMTSIFIFLNYSGIFNTGQTTVPYPVFSLLGLTIWQLFSSGVISCTNSLVISGGLITKINFPKETLIFSSISQSILDFIIRFIFLGIVFVIFRICPSWKIIFLPLFLIPLILFTIGLGFLFSLFNAFIHDISNLVSLFVTFLLFMTPVLYQQPTSKIYNMFYKLNIPGILIVSTRDIVLTGNISQPTLFFYSCIISILVFVIFWTLFHLVEPIVSDRI